MRTGSGAKKTLDLEAQAFRAMLRHAVESYPEECCGFILGRREPARKVGVDAARARNAAAGSRGSHYAIAAAELLAAEEAARAQGRQLVGIYHSHPDSPPGFSGEDLSSAYPWLSYVVISVRGGRVAGVRSWTAPEGVAEPERLMVMPAPPD